MRVELVKSDMTLTVIVTKNVTNLLLSDGKFIAIFGELETADTNAAYITKCVNLHSELLEALVKATAKCFSELLTIKSLG